MVACTRAYINGFSTIHKSSGGLLLVVTRQFLYLWLLSFLILLLRRSGRPWLLECVFINKGGDSSVPWVLFPALQCDTKDFYANNERN